MTTLLNKKKFDGVLENLSSKETCVKLLNGVVNRFIYIFQVHMVSLGPPNKNSNFQNCYLWDFQIFSESVDFKSTIQLICGFLGRCVHFNVSTRLLSVVCGVSVCAAGRLAA